MYFLTKTVLSIALTFTIAFNLFFTFVLYHVTEVVKTIVFTSVVVGLKVFSPFTLITHKGFIASYILFNHTTRKMLSAAANFAKKYKTFVSLMYHTFYL